MSLLNIAHRKFNIAEKVAESWTLQSSVFVSLFTHYRVTLALVVSSKVGGKGLAIGLNFDVNDIPSCD